MKKLYHISPINNKKGILNEGLKSGEAKYIYFFTDLIYPIPLFGIEGYLLDLIAANQVFIEEYDLYEINPEGLENRLMADRVSEFTASFQKRVKQMFIDPCFVNHIDRRKLDYESVITFNSLTSLFWMNPEWHIKNQRLIKSKNVSSEEQLPIPQSVKDEVKYRLKSLKS